MTNPMGLEGRTIMVTGANQGIGQAVAGLCAELGANLALVDVNDDAMGAMAAELGPERARAYAGSVADPGFVQDTGARRSATSAPCMA